MLISSRGDWRLLSISLREILCIRRGKPGKQLVSPLYFLSIYLSFSFFLEKYTAGLRVCPLKFSQDRSVLYANRAQMKRSMGLNDLAIKNCSKAIELNPNYLKALLRRAEIYEETEKLGDFLIRQMADKYFSYFIIDEALTDYQTVLNLDPRNVTANKAVRELPAKIEERNEKMKAEMMDNLKKLGNMVLKPFGLSTENFKLEQNESGSYNIQFNQK